VKENGWDSQKRGKNFFFNLKFKKKKKKRAAAAPAHFTGGTKD
jgi:hypothetical protein